MGNRHSDLGRIVNQRRKNYLALGQALSDLPGLRPLFDDLPEDTVPLVFPVYFEKPSLYFHNLKTAGVPIWRFGEYLDPSISGAVCKESRLLSEHVFQFPCHQELKAEELEWMVAKIRETVLAETGPGN